MHSSHLCFLPVYFGKNADYTVKPKRKRSYSFCNGMAALPRSLRLLLIFNKLRNKQAQFMNVLFHVKQSLRLSVSINNKVTIYSHVIIRKQQIYKNTLIINGIILAYIFKNLHVLCTHAI